MNRKYQAPSNGWNVNKLINELTVALNNQPPQWGWCDAAHTIIELQVPDWVDAAMLDDLVYDHKPQEIYDTGALLVGPDGKIDNDGLRSAADDLAIDETGLSLSADENNPDLLRFIGTNPEARAAWLGAVFVDETPDRTSRATLAAEPEEGGTGHSSLSLKASDGASSDPTELLISSDYSQQPEIGPLGYYDPSGQRGTMHRGGQLGCATWDNVTDPQSVASFVINAGSLGPNGWFAVQGAILLVTNNSTSKTMDILFSLDGTTLSTITPVATGAVSGNACFVQFTLYFSNQDAENANRFVLTVIDGAGASGTILTSGVIRNVWRNRTIDTTADRTFAITVTPSAGTNELVRLACQMDGPHYHA